MCQVVASPLVAQLIEEAVYIFRGITQWFHVGEFHTIGKDHYPRYGYGDHAYIDRPGEYE